MFACGCICTWVCTCSRDCMFVFVCACVRAYTEAVLHPTPSSNASARGTPYWLGIDPTPHLSVSLRGNPLPPCHPSANAHARALPLLSLPLLTSAVLLVVLPISIIDGAVRIGESPCSSTPITRHAHTGSSTGLSTGQTPQGSCSSQTVRVKEGRRCPHALPASAPLHDRGSEGWVKVHASTGTSV